MANGSDLAEEMLNSVNSGINSEDLSSTIANDHRWLQSEVFKQILKPVICELAHQAECGNYDARNKAVAKDCKQIADFMNWSY